MLCEPHAEQLMEASGASCAYMQGDCYISTVLKLFKLEGRALQIFFTRENEQFQLFNPDSKRPCKVRIFTDRSGALQHLLLAAADLFTPEGVNERSQPLDVT